MGRSVPGFSLEARFIADRKSHGNRRLRDTNTFGLTSPLRRELEDVWGECQIPNWDGNKAEPISREALEETYRFLESLPLGFPSPSVGSEPDGAVTIEWYFGRGNTLSVSIAGDGELHYAALVKSIATHGVERSSDGFPKAFYEIVRRISA